MRTEQQVEADNGLARAIENCIAAYGFEEDYVLTDFMVIATQNKLDEDGESVTAYSYLYRDSDMPYHRILGLLEVSKLRIQRQLMQED